MGKHAVFMGFCRGFMKNGDDFSAHDFSARDLFLWFFKNGSCNFQSSDYIICKTFFVALFL